MLKVVFAFAMLTLPQTPPPTKSGLQLPELVKECLEQGDVKGKVKIVPIRKSYFLKGDFDGDKLADYAVSIQGIKTRRNGILICNGKKQAYILGGDVQTTPPFSDMPNDNFVGPRWRIMLKSEAEALYNYDGNKPARAAFPKGDSIAFLWEDGTGVIYWDGARYRWGSGQ
jgi:hypothetical protein